MTESVNNRTVQGFGEIVTLPEDIERVLVQGNIGVLNADQRVQFYRSLCKSLGLNPVTSPFDYINMKGKTVLYAKKDATDQLRRLYGISIRVVDKHISEGVLTVTAEAIGPNGRTDTDIGSVNISNLKGEARANAYMKALTKAKRRVTLSICGLGMLDETELDSLDKEHKGFPKSDNTQKLNEQLSQITKPKEEPKTEGPKVSEDIVLEEGEFSQAELEPISREIKNGNSA